MPSEVERRVLALAVRKVSRSMNHAGATLDGLRMVGVHVLDPQENRLAHLIGTRRAQDDLVVGAPTDASLGQHDRPMSAERKLSPMPTSDPSQGEAEYVG